MSELTTDSVKKILWAVDPFSGDKDVLRSAAWAIRALVKAKPFQVQPVYIWNAVATEFPETSRSMLQEVQKKGQEELESVLSRVKISNILPLQVRPASFTAVRGAIHELVNIAKEREAELIVVSTHARKGVNRFLLGSFAETLILYSDVPLLIVHPNWRRTPEFKTILFPTDFSAESIDAFQKVLQFGSSRKSRIILFHKPGLPAIPTFDFAYATATPYYQEIYEADVKENESKAKELVAQGKQVGVRVDVIFDRSKTGSVFDAILRHSKRLSCMIAMTSRSGSLSAVILGSTTRQVVRYSEQPVWVIHPTLHKHSERQTERGTPQVEPLFVNLLEARKKRSA